jgi:hypothetical protein
MRITTIDGGKHHLLVEQKEIEETRMSEESRRGGGAGRGRSTGGDRRGYDGSHGIRRVWHDEGE